MSLCDRELVLFFLARRSGAAAAMFIRHVLFAGSTGILFDYFWQQAEPLTAETAKEISAASMTKTFEQLAAKAEPPARLLSQNGRRDRYAKN
jgi:hypothetical protein